MHQGAAVSILFRLQCVVLLMIDWLLLRCYCRCHFAVMCPSHFRGVRVTSPWSQSHLKFFRVESESWLGRVVSESSHENCRVTSSHWFASSSQCRVTRNFTFSLRHFLLWNGAR